MLSHDQSFKNRSMIEAAATCSCFNCLKAFPALLIKKWTDDSDTALCPFCQMDTVLAAPPSGGIDIEQVITMNRRWINTPEPNLLMAEDEEATVKVVEEQLERITKKIGGGPMTDRAKLWQEENQESIAAWNAYVEKHGLPLGGGSASRERVYQLQEQVRWLKAQINLLRE